MKHNITNSEVLANVLSNILTNLFDLVINEMIDTEGLSNKEIADKAYEQIFSLLKSAKENNFLIIDGESTDGIQNERCDC